MRRAEEPSTLELTVVIPHLDAPDGLARCLAALAAQQADADTTRTFHVIVVDNGSAEMPEAICADHGFVTLVREPEPGPGPARNLGARLAATPLLAFIDSDCVARPGWIAAILGTFRARPEIDVLGGDVRIARRDPARPTAIEAYESVYGYRMQMYISRDRYTASCNMAVRRAAFLRVGGFAGIGMSEDRDWGQRATRLGLRMAYVPEMRIETPARKDFAELKRKWDRHIAHDFGAVRSVSDHGRWVLRALALAISPLPEIVRVARSDRISGLAVRALAVACLARIRLYRSYRMLLTPFAGRSAAAVAWRDPRAP